LAGEKRGKTRRRKEPAKQAVKEGRPDGGPRPDHLSQESFNYYWLVAAIVVAAAVVLRTAFLNADPPWNFTWSQALFTDGARAIDGARSKVVFDTWIPDMRSPVVLFYPLINILAFVIFKVAGVGLFQANLAGVLPAIAATVLVFAWMRRLGGSAAGLLAMIFIAFSYTHIIYSRVPMVESLLILLLLAAFYFALKRTGGLVISGFLVGLAAFMLKMHALHFVPVVLVYLLIRPRPESRETGGESAGAGNGAAGAGRPSADHRQAVAGWRLAAGFMGGLAAAVALWVALVYFVNPEVIAKYFKSNILIAQQGEYAGAGPGTVMWRRLDAFLHIGSGRDGFFAATPVMSVLAYLGLLSVISGLFGARPGARDWERLAAVWFVGLTAALSLLSYRPLRYMVLLTPSTALLATAFMLRLARGRSILSSPRSSGFVYAFGAWLVWVLIHIQHDLVFRILSGGSAMMGRPSTPGMVSLYRFHLSSLRHLLIFGGLALAVCLIFRGRLLGARLKLRRSWTGPVLAVVLLAFVSINMVSFARYAAGRRYTIIDTARSLKQILSAGVFMVGDCSTTLSLETGFRTLPAYGDLIRYDEKEKFGKYPVTHFLLRFPTLYEYLDRNYPEFKSQMTAVASFMLCGREATVVRFEAWPGDSAADYSPSLFERAMDQVRGGEFVAGSRLLESFIDDHPDSYTARSLLAFSRLQTGQADEALAEARRALELTHRDALSYEIHGDILNSLGRQAEARAEWSKALELNPGRRSLQAKLGLRRQ
jgi:hypothetical protein